MSKARKSARDRDCTLRLACCNYNPETTVLCHLRMNGWGGMSIKPPDYLAVFACSNCHDALDRRSDTICSDADVLRALGETLIALETSGVLVVK